MKYLSASTLGITPEERAALIKTKALIKKLELPKDLKTKVPLFSNEPQTPKFDMGETSKQYACGTAACIGGWMKLQMMGALQKGKVKVSNDMAREVDTYVWNQYNILGPMKQLFFPKNLDIDRSYNTITPADAIKEITKFLVTGKAEW